MLIFRSEENVHKWCEEREIPVRPLVTIPQLWHLAVTWYENRLTVDSRRPEAEEMTGIFAEVGLIGSFWDPTADTWESATG